MSMTIKATLRDDQGKGASRRLRRNEQIPAIVYGAGKEATSVALNVHEITHLLDDDAAYTSILKMELGKSNESVIVKDLQRHPARNEITHVDFLRIDMKQPIVTNVPLSFIGAEDNPALRLGAMLNRFVTSVEVTCLPGDLPHAIEVNVADIELGGHVSLSDLNMPEGVTLMALTHGESHDQSVVAVQANRKMAAAARDEEDDAAPAEADADAEAEGESEE